jgi:hypothetical protein
MRSHGDVTVGLAAARCVAGPSAGHGGPQNCPYSVGPPQRQVPGSWYEPATRKGVGCRLGGSIFKIAFQTKGQVYYSAEVRGHESHKAASAEDAASEVSMVQV